MSRPREEHDLFENFVHNQTFPIQSLSKDLIINKFLIPWLAQGRSPAEFQRFCAVHENIRKWCDDVEVWDRLFISLVIAKKPVGNLQYKQYMTSDAFKRWTVLKEIMPLDVTRLYTLSLIILAEADGDGGYTIRFDLR